MQMGTRVWLGSNKQTAGVRVPDSELLITKTLSVCLYVGWEYPDKRATAAKQCNARMATDQAVT